MNPWTVATLLTAAAAAHPDTPAQRFQRDGAWHDVTYADLAAAVEELARGWIGLGIQPGDRVCLLADTSPAWTAVDLSLATIGAIVVPIYAASSPDEVEWVAGNAGAVAIVCGAEPQVATFDKVRMQLPALTTVIVIDPDAAFPAALGLQDVRDRGAQVSRQDVHRRRDAVMPGDPFTFVYTSGTTGPPKGCVLTHANLHFVCETLREVTVIEHGDRVFLFLPLAHVFARLVQLGTILMGATIVYSGLDPTRLVAEMAETRPTYLPSIPRLFEKIHTLATASVSTPEDRAWMQGAVAVGLRVRALQDAGQLVPLELQTAFDQAEDRVYGRVRALFGGALKEAVTGAAPIAPEILELFRACGVTVLEGFGMTETTAAATTSTLANHRFGTVGRALPGTELRVAGDGELLVRGPHVFAGYHGDPEATARVLVDGWLHTGDLAAIDTDGYVTITGRKKDIIITAGGKNISPASLENLLRQSRWISHAVMHGDRRPYVVALITLDPDQIGAFAAEHGLPDDLSTLAEASAVRALIQDVVDEVNSRFAPPARIKCFRILDRDLSPEFGELTPTLKVRRQAVADNHAAILDAMYEQVSA